MLVDSVSALKDISMTPETEVGEEYSPEDGQNVEIPSMIEPLIHEIWSRLVVIFKSVCARVLYYDEIGEIVCEFAKAESKTKWSFLEKKVAKLKDD